MALLEPIEIRYENLYYDIVLPRHDLDTLPNLYNLLVAHARSAVRLVKRESAETVTLHALEGINGVLRAGTATLLIANPGAGTTTLLKLLSGRMPPQQPGQLLYNGADRRMLDREGVNLNKVTSLAPELDEHEPLLTVRETFNFAYEAAVPEALRPGPTRAQPVRQAATESNAPASTAPPSGGERSSSSWWSRGLLSAFGKGGRGQPQGGDGGTGVQPPQPLPPPPPTAAVAGPTGSERAGSTAVAAPPSAPPLGKAPPTQAMEEEHDDAWWNRTRTPEEMIDILGLRECVDTIVGSNQIRGVSGGQKKRVTIGEALLGNARVLALDSITSGLDAATAFDIMRYLATWAHKTGGIMIAALQQATPEIGQLFDDVILLSDGLELYHGPYAQLEPYLNSIGFVRPSYMDVLDFASELVSFPTRAAELSVEDRRQVAEGEDAEDSIAAEAAATGADHADGLEGGRQQRRSSAAGAEAGTGRLAGNALTPWLTSAPQLCAYWRASPSCSSMMGYNVAAHSHLPPQGHAAAGTAAPGLPAGATTTDKKQAATAVDGAEEPAPALLKPQYYPQAASLDVNAGRYGAPLTGGIPLTTEGAMLAYSNRRPVSVWKQTALTYQRQIKLVFRNKGLMIAKLVNSLLMSIILGTLFLNPPYTSYQLKFGLALFSSLFISFTNSAEIPASIQSRAIVYRQTGAAMYTELAYVCCNVLALLPINIIADLIYGSILYWLTGWVATVNRWLVFLLALLLIDMAMASFFRFNAYCFSTQEVAQAAGTGLLSVFILFAGFFVISSQIPGWLRWIIYISPFYWVVVTIINNELLAPRYAVPAASVLPGSPAGITLGELFASTYSFPLSAVAQWGGVIFLLGFGMLFNFFLAPLALHYIRYDVHPGTARRLDDVSLLPVTVEEMTAAWGAMYALHVTRSSGSLTTSQQALLQDHDVTAPAAGSKQQQKQQAAQPTSERGNERGWEQHEGQGQGPHQQQQLQGPQQQQQQQLEPQQQQQQQQQRGGQPSGEAGPTPLQLSAVSSAASVEPLGAVPVPAPPVMFPAYLAAIQPHMFTPLSTRDGRGPAVETPSGAAAAAAAVGGGPQGPTTVPHDSQTNVEGAPSAGPSVLGGPAQHVAVRVNPNSGQQLLQQPAGSGTAQPGAVQGPGAVEHAGESLSQQQPPTASQEAKQAEAKPVTLPFPRVTLAFKDVTYSVKVGGSAAAGGEYRHLLRGVSGWCRPSSMTALMGASGAGKTTLIDYLSFRKTAGVIGGSLRLNGQAVTPAVMARVSGYCEQEDIHLPTATVEEALVFSSRLRLATEAVSEKQRMAFIQRVLTVLELDTVKHRTVGTLSRGERKRLTVGVELVASPSVLFLDEPTSALDARAAAVVMRVLRRVASSGRTVVATIHQPSAEIFFSFDHLLLLAPGGYQVYFGRLGHHASCLVKYLSKIPGVAPLPPATNPASWMLDVLGVGINRHRGEEDERSAAPGAPQEIEAALLAGMPAAPQYGSGLPASTAPARAPDEEDAGGRSATTAIEMSNMGPSASSNGIAASPSLPQSQGGAHRAAAHAPASDTAAQALAVLPPLPPSRPAREPVDFAAWYMHSALARHNDQLLNVWLGEAPIKDARSATSQSGAAGAEVSPPACTKTECVSPIPGKAGSTFEGQQQPSKGDQSGAGAAKDLDPTDMQPLVFTTASAIPAYLQLWYVLRRAVLDMWRNGETQQVRLFVLVYLGVLFGLIFVNVNPTTFQGTVSRIGFVLGGVAFSSVLFFSTGVTVHFQNRDVYYRERAAHYYWSEAYSLSILVADIPWVALFTVVNVSIAYWIAGLNPSASAFFFFCFGAFLLSLFWMAAGQAYAALFPILPIAQLVGGLTISITFLFAGLFITVAEMPPFWKGLYYAVPTSHVLRALGTSQLYCAGGAAAGCPQITVVTASGPVTEDRYQYVETFLSSTYQDRWDQLGWVVLAFAVMAVISVLSLRFVNHQKR